MTRQFRTVCAMILIMGLSACLTLTACSTCTTRYRYDTPLDKRVTKQIGSVAITLREYADCEVTAEHTCSFESLLASDGWLRDTSAEKEDELVTVVRHAIEKHNHEVTVVPLKARGGASPGPDSTPPAYLIRLSAYTATKKAAKTNYDAGVGFVGIFPVLAWTATNNSPMKSHCIAELIDSSSSGNVGKLGVESYGISATTYSFLYILPMPPIPRISRTEKTACERLGELVGKVLGGDDLKTIPLEAKRK